MSKYSINQLIDVKISSVVPYGAFVVVDDEYTGLIHISEINGKYINDITQYFKIDEIKRVKVIGIDETEKKLSLSMRGIPSNLRNKSKLSETKLGFDLFDEILPEWINEKMTEIENANNKKIS